MRGVVVSLSGGLDSTCLLFKMLRDGREPVALTVDYGQRHRREIAAARVIGERAGVDHRVVDLSGLATAGILAGSSQTDQSIAVPEGHYTDESMKLTVVPNRNMLLLACAIAWAVSLKADGVAYAAHAGDHTIYPDCREEFAEAMARAAALCDWHPVALLRPFIGLTKADIVKLGSDLGAPLALTWSCYKGGERHCGKCGTCVERREAFALAGVGDPTEYER